MILTLLFVNPNVNLRDSINCGNISSVVFYTYGVFESCVTAFTEQEEKKNETDDNK